VSCIVPCQCGQCPLHAMHLPPKNLHTFKATPIPADAVTSSLLAHCFIWLRTVHPPPQPTTIYAYISSYPCKLAPPQHPPYPFTHTLSKRSQPEACFISLTFTPFDHHLITNQPPPPSPPPQKTYSFTHTRPLTPRRLYSTASAAGIEVPYEANLNNVGALVWLEQLMVRRGGT